MRIKWNRHLDGSTSRRGDEEPGTQEAEEKKASSPGIFKIFRRKKNRRRAVEESKNVGAPLGQSEMDDDDAASVSSIATCASQPVTEVFQRDRSSSLFSSFRLSLPGSKRKKRKITPVPSETLLNGQDNEPQVERYSTPDLRKPPDKLIATKDVKSNLSTSSPSIRKGSFASAQSLDVQNSESLDKLKWSSIKGATGSSVKLSKSVSFSDCGDSLIDSSHSRRDNKTLRAANSQAMVEEDFGAVESELPSCMTDNPRTSRESKYTTVDDVVNPQTLHRDPSSGAVGFAVMTKSEQNDGADIIQDNISYSGNNLNDISTEIVSCAKTTSSGEINRIRQVNEATSPVNISANGCNKYGNETFAELSEEEKVRNKTIVEAKKSSNVPFSGGDISLPANNSCVTDSRFENQLLYSEKSNSSCPQKLDIPSNSDVPLNKKLDVIASEFLTASHDLSAFTSCESVPNDSDEVSDSCHGLLNEYNYDIKFQNYSPSEQISGVNSKHVPCHMKIYENEQKSNDPKVVQDKLLIKKPVRETSEAESVKKEAFISNYENLNFLNCALNESDCDQKVPDSILNTRHAHRFQSDQKVPEFELSLLEFEEVCSRYMSRSYPELSYCSSTIPLYGSSPKRKSVLDLNASFIYSNCQKNDDGDKKFPISRTDNVSFGWDSLIKQDYLPHLPISCQIATEKSLLPSPPRQWINGQKPIDTQSCRDVCTEEVQCTKVHGKYLCQDLYPEALPNSVTPAESDLGFTDTPQQSSSSRAVENKSGRRSIVTNEKKHLSDDQVSEDRTSSISTLDYSYVSEKSEKASVYLDSEIRDVFRGARAICDPLVYGPEVKVLESLGPENYLVGHNFCEGFGDVIRDDYVRAGNGLIEISNPYEEETFLLPQDLSSRSFMKNLAAPLPKDGMTVALDCDNLELPISAVDENFNSELPEFKGDISITNGEQELENQISAADLKQPVENRIEPLKDKELSYVEQKNFVNKNKVSMIPCRTKGCTDIEAKTKSKKNNSLPRNKNESHLPVRSNKCHRVSANACKDSGAEHHRGKLKSHPVGKSNGSLLVNSKSFDPGIIRLASNSCDDHEVMSEDPDNCTKASSPKSASQSFITAATFKNKSANSFNVDIHTYDSDDSKNDFSLIPFSISEIKPEVSPETSSSPLDYIKTCDKIISESVVQTSELFCTLCCSQLDIHRQIGGFTTENVEQQCCSNHSDITDSSRRYSLPTLGLRKTSLTSSKDSLSSQLTSSSSKGRSRIPRKQTGPRVAASSERGPVRPPMWRSKAELTQEIQRLGTLCETRTKELNRLKMETKHVSSGFDAFAALFKYMVEDLNGLSVPDLTKDLEKTLKQLELTKQDLAFYEREVEEMKSHHCQELNDLSNKLFEVYQSEVAELNAKHQEEMNHLKSDHQQEVEHLTTTYDTSSTEVKNHHDKMIANLEQEIINQREELQQFHEQEIRDLEEKQVESSKLLQEHIEQLQKKCADLKQHSMSMEDAMKKDTDSKLQWVTAAKVDLAKEVESLKAVLEMKNKELHTIRVQNLEMEKQLEDLPLAREKIKMLQARAEDLEALMVEKTKLERQLATENQEMRDTYERETKVNRRLSMENEELQWRLRQAENSLISGSFSDVPEYVEDEEAAPVSPTKSPGPQTLSRSVFFTFVDKDESSPHSPRSLYKKITPNFAANYKTSPAKSTKSPPSQSPRRPKSHSEPPQPLTNTSTPRKVAKHGFSKTKSAQKRQRSGSDSGRLVEHTEVNFSSVAESMTSSVSSESSVFEHRERLLEENPEQFIHSLEILREQRSAENSVDEPTLLARKWPSDEIKITADFSNLETGDMSRSAEFADPKTYYHMTFAVLKEAGMTDCDMEDGSKNSSAINSPTKEAKPRDIMHSTSENNIHRAVEADGVLQVMSMSLQGDSSTVSKNNSCTESMLSADNVQNKADGEDKVEDHWRTI